jgi:FtsP/CotA-like multicopper oxidase with cupredoxin domain
MHFVLEERGRRVDTGRDFSPELDLVRGEPVAIMIVNRLPEPTSIHWHGIEIEDSYMDGAPGFSGSGTHLTPEIAPGDSFVARFTPPRAGTFMYHAHVDDVREQLGGLEGALIVRERGIALSNDDHVLFLKGYTDDAKHPLEMNGRADPDTIVLHTGQPARLRFINLSTVNPAPLIWLTARPDSAAQLVSDSMLVQWRLAAKDGFERPQPERELRLAREIVAVGETYDFEYEASRPGALRLEVRVNDRLHQLLIRVAIRVE